MKNAKLAMRLLLKKIAQVLNRSILKETLLKIKHADHPADRMKVFLRKKMTANGLEQIFRSIGQTASQIGK